MKRKILWSLFALVSILLIAVLTLFAVVFYNPTLLVNPKNIQLVLNKTHILKSWSWKEAEIEHEWIKWNDRKLSGHFKDLCLVYENSSAELDTCIEEISWNFNPSFSIKDGFHSITLNPLKVRSKRMDLTLKENPTPQPSFGPPDIWGYWKMLWNKLVPDMDMEFTKISIKSGGKKTDFDLKLIKSEQKLITSALGFHLEANEKTIVLKAPTPYRLPDKIGVPLYLRGVKLTAHMHESGIPIVLTGALDGITFVINSKLDLPLKDELTSIKEKRSFLLNTTGKISLLHVKENLKKNSPKPFDTLPAPLNAMDGDIITTITTQKLSHENSVLIKTMTNVDLEGGKEFLEFSLGLDLPLELKNFTPGALLVSIDLKKVALALPRMSKKALPPQFMPDPRIKSIPFGTVSKKKASGLTLNLSATGDNALAFKTNLLDEVLRMNLDLHFAKGNLQKGELVTLPLKTKVFKRALSIPQVKIIFRYPVDPLIEATIYFLLPEYKITLKLEGPLSKPRYSFNSQPPLPQNDIFAVLLFGRPMADLNPDDKTAANRTNQLLSQGILSLTVLYFLAGSPVEYVGYDSTSSNATAQFGLNKKTSLQVGAGAGGLNSTAVRHSLGKGWYLDTSVDRSTDSTSSSETKTYGVLLERIIAY